MTIIGMTKLRKLGHRDKTVEVSLLDNDIAESEHFSLPKPSELFFTGASNPIVHPAFPTKKFDHPNDTQR